MSNGLVALFFPRTSAMTTQMAIALRYGSNSDPEEKSGTAHFLEHMIAGGSAERIRLSRDIERLGGSVDFFTTHDYTMIVADVLPDKGCETADILCKLIFDSQFEKENFEKEQKIILHEIAEAKDNPWIQIDEMLTRCLYHNHPVKNPVSGYAKTVRGLTLNDIEQIHSAQYVPNNIILALSGQFNSNLKEAILQTFAATKQNCALVPSNGGITESKPPKSGVTQKRAGLSQAYLSIGARTVSGKHSDIPALELINIMLGGGASSRLFIEMREKSALAYNILSSQECGIDYGYFHVDCAVNPKNLTKATNLLIKELQKICAEQVSDAELNKAKDMILGAIYREVDSPTNLPETLTSMEMLFGSENALADYINKLKRITAQEIAETASKYFKEDNYSIVTLTPKL
ncbi:MAG: insulinase family protein [Candidatus Bathyarchaeota archaeon]|nr:insulinase family protein [Candidatus Bathyarchaeota archaeon]